MHFRCVTLLVGLAALAAGCAEVEPAGNRASIGLRIDEDFTAYERAHILRSVADWNFALNGQVAFDIAYNAAPAGWSIVRSDSSSAVLAQTSSYGTRLAVTVSTGKGGGAIYLLVDRLKEHDLPSVVMHELGHVLGLRHEPYGLMSPYYSSQRRPCIDQRTVHVVAQVRRLNANTMRWCRGLRSPADHAA